MEAPLSLSLDLLPFARRDGDDEEGRAEDNNKPNRCIASRRIANRAACDQYGPSLLAPSSPSANVLWWPPNVGICRRIVSASGVLAPSFMNTNDRAPTIAACARAVAAQKNLW